MKLFFHFFATVILSFTSVTHAAVIFDPPAPMITPGGQIQIRATNAVRPLIWTAGQGSIVGFPNSIGATYTASSGVERALDVVSVVDALGNTGTVGVLIQSKAEIIERFKPENAQWNIYQNSTDIPGVGSISTDGLGGLWAVPFFSSADRPIEELSDLFYRDADNNWTVHGSTEAGNIKTLSSDIFGGLWLGGRYNALFYLDGRGNWTKKTYDFNIYGSGATVTNIIPDGTGGLWVVAEEVFDDGFIAQLNVSLNHIDEKGNLSRNVGYWFYPIGIWNYFIRYGATYGISSLRLDGMSGLWVSFYTDGGLKHLDESGNWKSYQNDLYISSISFDDAGELWMATRGNGLYRLDTNGNWIVYHTGNSNLPSNDLSSLSTDNAGGIWVGTTEHGLVHKDMTGNWSIYNTSNSKLPNNFIYEILSDNVGGLWIKSGDGTFDDGLNTVLAYLSFGQKNRPDLPATLILNQHTFVNNQHLYVIQPAQVNNQDNYMAVAMPDGTLFLLTDLNTGQPFIDTLPHWQGGDVVIDFTVDNSLPRGEYTLFLLRVPTSINPLENTSKWQLGINSFTVK